MSTAVFAFPPATPPSEPALGASSARMPEPAGTMPFEKFSLRSEPRPEPSEGKPGSTRRPESASEAEPGAIEARPRRPRNPDDSETNPPAELLVCPCAVAVLPPPPVEPAVATGTTAGTALLPASTEPASLINLPPTTASGLGSDPFPGAAGDWRESLRSHAALDAPATTVPRSAENAGATAPELVVATEGALLSRAFALPKTDAETILPSVSPESGSEPGPAGAKPAEMAVKAGESLHGTHAASPTVEVKSWFQRDEFAALTPPPSGAGATVVATSRLNRERQTTSLPTAETSGVTSLASDRPSETTVTSNLPDLPAVSPADHVAKVTALLQDQVVRFRQTARESVEVVLRPDSQTELHVQLVQRAGQIEATVRCDRGDTQALGGNWSRLQESLAQQGVRLAPLGESSLGFAGEHSRQGFNSPRPQLPEAPQFAPGSRSRNASSVPPITLTAGNGPRTASTGTSRRALESWA